MAYKFYGDMVSPPVRAVYFTIKMLNIEAEFIKVDLLSAENKTEKYLQVNPHGTVPCIHQDGNVFTDSHAINIYFANKFGGEKLYPSNPEKRAAIDEILFSETCVLFAPLQITVKKLLKSQAEVDEFAIELFEHGYNWIEIYLKKNKYIAGDDLTIADFSVMTTITTMELLVPVKEDKFPQLSTYLQQATSWPHYAEIQEDAIDTLKKFFKEKSSLFSQNSTS